MKWFLKYVSKQNKLIFIGLILCIILVLLELAIPYLLKIIIDDVIIGRNSGIFLYLVGTMVIITITRVILGYIKGVIFNRTCI